MKGIILAGGKATRLRPLTKVTSKQLLPVYDRPMIYYPIETLAKSGIKDILVIVAPEYSGHFLNLLGSGKNLGLNFSYEVQEEPRGLADAFIVGQNFIGGDDVVMILGDNIFEHDFSESIKTFKSGCKIFAKKVHDPERFGVVEFDENFKVVSIQEKPASPKSDYAAVGVYIYDNKVLEYAKKLKPSERGELEIVDLHNEYLKRGELEVGIIEGMWEDAGTFESLLRVSNFMAAREKDKAS
ncbi:MAG: NTP transferase domain-containing protein [Candidatus Levybacteria bacterium]|nr:NTP transferase domain-containing protein [Candidatus Levybacteria bacterium]MBP9815297.1 NTP transferase domain-containing protein [Candidatus Levybacteria bacterium]